MGPHRCVSVGSTSTVFDSDGFSWALADMFQLLGAPTALDPNVAHAGRDALDGRQCSNTIPSQGPVHEQQQRHGRVSSTEAAAAMWFCVGHDDAPATDMWYFCTFMQTGWATFISGDGVRGLQHKPGGASAMLECDEAMLASTARSKGLW